MENDLLFGKYIIKGKLGQGGMAIVYHAFDPTLQRDVAIKALLPKFKNNTNIVKMFIREGQLMAQLDNPHIVQVYENAKYKDFFFYVMEYIGGKTLDKLIKNGLSYAENEVIFREILKALIYIHKKNILHLDLKPSNILVESSGNVKITDFGIGADITKEMISKNAVVGTIKYIAPEQITGDEINFYTDIYQLGVILYQMYSGNIPFEGTNEEVMRQKLNEEPQPLNMSNILVPDYISSICTRMLRINSTDRYKSVDEILEDMDNLKSYTSSYESERAEVYEAEKNRVYTADAISNNVKKERKKKKKEKFFVKIFIIFILLLIGFVLLIHFAEKCERIPIINKLLFQSKSSIVANYTIYKYDDSIEFAQYCIDHFKYKQAEEILLPLKERYPKKRYIILKMLFDIYYSYNDEKFITISKEILKIAPNYERYFLNKRLGDFYSEKNEVKLSRIYYNQAIKYAPNDELKKAIYKKIK